MPRTVFSNLTERAAQHLQAAQAELAASRPKGDSQPSTGAPAVVQGDPLAGVASDSRDLADALVQLGRTVRGRAHQRPDTQDRVLTALEIWAERRPWPDLPAPAPAPLAHELRQATRCIRAATDLWSTHRTGSGQPRSPEASMLRHPAMSGAAMRHWQALVGQVASLARELAGRPESLGPDVAAAMGAFPRTSWGPVELPPVPLPVARPGIGSQADILDAIDDRLDRIHRHIWNVAATRTMSAAVLMNAAAIGMLLARAAAEAERLAAAGQPTRPGGARSHPTRADSALDVTLSDLSRWAQVAAGLTTVRTADAPTTVLQVERLDLARLLEGVVGASRPRGADRRPTAEDAAERLVQGALRYRAVAATCATSVRYLYDHGSLYLAGRALPAPVLDRKPELVDACLADRVVPIPPAVARRIEAQLHAIGAGRPATGSAA